MGKAILKSRPVDPVKNVGWPFTDPIGGLDPLAWDALAGGHLYSSSHWLRFAAADPGTTAGGLCIDLHGGGRAGIPVTTIEHESSSFYDWNRLLRDAGLPVLGPQGLLAGAHRGYQTHVLATPGVSGEHAAHVVLGGLRALRREMTVRGIIGGPRGPAPCVGMFLSTGDVLALRAAGETAMPVVIEPDAWIPVPEGGWDGYLASLPSKRRIDMVRRDRKRFDAAGYEVTHTTLAECVRETARLLAQTERRYGSDADPGALADSIALQSEKMGTRARVLLAGRPGEPPIGYCLFYVRGDTLYLRAAGFDYERMVGAAEYFNLVYYLPLKIAIEIGARWVHAGIAATEAKALRGATLRPLWMLDLTESSVLRGHDAEIRAHNAARYARLGESSTAIQKALVEHQWRAFC